MATSGDACPDESNERSFRYGRRDWFSRYNLAADISSESRGDKRPHSTVILCRFPPVLHDFERGIMGYGLHVRWQVPVLLAVLSSGLSWQARSDDVPSQPKEGQPAAATTRRDETRSEPGIPAVNPLPFAPAAPEHEGNGKPAPDDSRHAVPINLPAALQLAGVRPLDIAAATLEVKQGLAVLLQAKVLWIPNLNAGVDYFRHDGVQQNIFTGDNFRKDRQSFFVGGGPTLNVALTDAIYEPLAQRRVVAARVANVQTARNDVLLAVSQAYFTLQDARGRLSVSRRRSSRAQCLVDFAVGLAPA